MDYETDKKMEESTMSGLGSTPASLEKRPPPSCMREHIDQLQTIVDGLVARADIRDNRILKLEGLVG